MLAAIGPPGEPRQQGQCQQPGHPVGDFEEVRSFGLVDSKIGTMAALRQIPGVRAEVAMLSLSRAYFANCTRRGGKWTAGLHLLFWTLKRLDREPNLEATDIRGPISFSLEKTIALSQWMLIALRLSLISDVASRALAEHDAAGKLVKFVQATVERANVDEPQRLLAAIRRSRKAWQAALTVDRYEHLREALHVDDPPG